MNTKLRSSVYAVEVLSDKGRSQFELSQTDHELALEAFQEYVDKLQRYGWKLVIARADGSRVVLDTPHRLRPRTTTLRLVEIPQVVKTTHFSPALLAFGVASVQLQGAE